MANNQARLKWDFKWILSEPDSSTLWASRRFDNPPLILVLFHFSNKLWMILGQNESLRDKIIMHISMNSLHLLNVFTHAVFSRQLPRPWKMIYSLKFIHLREKSLFQVSRWPTDCPIVRLDLSKSIVFKCVSYNLYICVIKFEIVAFIRRLIRSEIHWIDIRSENQVLFTWLFRNFFVDVCVHEWFDFLFFGFNFSLAWHRWKSMGSLL